MRQSLTFAGFFSRNRPAFLWSLGLFLGGTAAGLFLPREAHYALFDALLTKADRMGEISVYSLFLNNLGVALLAAAGGLLVAVTPLLLLLNGLMLGGMLSLFSPVLGWGNVLASVMLHGVWEIAALVMASGIGLAVSRRVLGMQPQRDTARELFHTGAGVLIKICLPLLALAAVLEMTVSQAVVRRAMQSASLHAKWDDILPVLQSEGWQLQGLSLYDYIELRREFPELQHPLPALGRFTNRQAQLKRLYYTDHQHRRVMMDSAPERLLSIKGTLWIYRDTDGLFHFWETNRPGYQ